MNRRKFLSSLLALPFAAKATVLNPCNYPVHPETQFMQVWIFSSDTCGWQKYFTWIVDELDSGEIGCADGYLYNPIGVGIFNWEADGIRKYAHKIHKSSIRPWQFGVNF